MADKASTELTAASGASLANIADLLPDLVQTQTMEIEGQDINFPRLKVSHPSQDFVPDTVPAFAIYSELNLEDDNKITLFELPSKQDKPDFEKTPDAGVLVYVLAMRKGLSANMLEGRPVPRNTAGAIFMSWAYDDPSAPRGKNVDTTFNYVLYVPEVDASKYPHRLLLTRTSTQTARTINTWLRDAMDQGLPPYVVPIKLWSEKRERTADGQKQRWAIFKARTVQDPNYVENVKAASDMMARVNELSPAQQAKGFDASDDVVVDGTAEPAL